MMMIIIISSSSSVARVRRLAAPISYLQKLRYWRALEGCKWWQDITYVCVYTYLSLYIYIYIYICISLSLSISRSLYIYIYIHIHLYTYSALGQVMHLSVVKLGLVRYVEDALSPIGQSEATVMIVIITTIIIISIIIITSSSMLTISEAQHLLIAD